MSLSTSIHKRALLLVLALTCAISLALGQRTVNVAQGVGTLNDAIAGDTTASGARVDTNTVYVLARGGLYLTTSTIENLFPLRIEAAAGSGARPVVQPAVLTGGVSNRNFRPRADLTLKGLYVTNRDELGGLLTNIIRVTANNARIVIDDCHLDADGQSAIRTDNAGISIFLTNSIVSNIGTVASPNNGRGIDDRGVALDSVIVENCTFYNLTSRVYRDGGALTNVVRFNHNTVVNVLEHISTFGPVGDFRFSNNLIANGGFLGRASSEGRRGISLDSTANQKAVIVHNNFFVNAAVKAAWPDTILKVENYNDYAQKIVTEGGWGATITEDSVGFTNGPDVPTAVLAAFNRGTQTGTVDMDTTGGPFDFAFGTGLSVYTASEAGQPLGDLTWFSMTIIPTSVSTVEAVPDHFSLEANFPNPFNPETSIRYTLGGETRVALSVFNILGQHVRTLVDQQQPSGSYTARWDGTTDKGVKAASGIYLYRLSVDGRSLVRKMTLQK